MTLTTESHDIEAVPDTDIVVVVEPASVVAPPRRRRVARLAGQAGWALLGAAVFVALWQLAASRAADLPTPAETFTKLRHMLADPFYDNGPNDKGIGRQLLISLQRVGSGFLLAAVAGIPLGLAIGASRRAWAAINPIVQVLRPVSPLAWFPIWLTVSQDAGRASVMVIFVTALWPCVVNTAAGAAAVPLEQRNVARVFRFGRLARVRHVIVPNAMPGIVTGLRLSMGISWMVIVAVEMLSGGAGIGFFVWDSYNTGNLSAVASAIAVIGAIGFLLDAVFLRLGRRVSGEVGA